MKIYDLPVMQGREKSFYGKAKVIEEDNGERFCNPIIPGFAELPATANLSECGAGTVLPQCGISIIFLTFFNVDGGGKSWWDGLPVEEPKKRPGPDMTNEESFRAMIGRRMGKAV